MEGKDHGTEAAQNAQQQDRPKEPETQSIASEVESSAYEAQIAERDARIVELEAQVAEAAKTAEATEQLKSKIEELKAQGESERLEFKLKLAGCRNVKAARAVLEDHGGDVSALKEAEPWMFVDASAKQSGKTGLPNAGVAKDSEKQMKHWREIAGLDD